MCIASFTSFKPMEKNNIPISILQSFQSLSLTSTTIEFGREFASNKTPEEIAAAINQFLGLHASNKVDKFHLYFCPSEIFLPDIGNWVAYVTGKGVQDVSLDFSMQLDDSIEELIYCQLPASLFKCKTLTNLSLSLCDFSPLPDFASFECLRSFSLKNVNVTGGNFQQFITNCPLLDSLSMILCSSVDPVIISSPRLQKLTMVNPSSDIVNLEISAPNLKSFIYFGMHIFGDSDFEPIDSFIDISSLSDAFISAIESSEPEDDFIKLVYDLRNVKVLTVCTYTLMRVQLYNDDEKLPILLQNLKELQLLMGTMSSENLGGIYSFFRLCPSQYLDKLFIQLSIYSGDVKGELYDRQQVEDPSDVIFNHLRVIKVSNFKGCKGEMRLLAFLLQKSVNLESLILVGPSKYVKQNMDTETSTSLQLPTWFQVIPPTWIEDLVAMRLQICQLPKASSRAKVILYEHAEDDDMSLTPTHTEYFEEY